jgi:hypothetical protein
VFGRDKGVGVEHDWLIREIEGLRDYAALNGLPRLAEALDQARLVALVELASASGGPDGAAPETAD